MSVRTMTTVRRAATVMPLATALLALAVLASAQPLPGERWAVVVGVGAYDHASVSPARHAVADAEAMYQMLVGPMGFKPDHVLLLTDRAERKPTLKNVQWALGTFLARSARRDDTVLIYFAGHGMVEVDPRGMERDGLARYLVPLDADPDDLHSTAFPMDTFQAIFARLEAERVVVFLDASYSGAAGGGIWTSKRAPGAPAERLLERLARRGARAIIAASRPTEVSVGLAELGHGLFTYYLLEGLNGAADHDGDGIVTVQEVYKYVERHVTTKARSAGVSQHPMMRGEIGGTLPLHRVRQP